MKQAEKLLPKPSSHSLKKSTIDKGPSSSGNRLLKQSEKLLPKPSSLSLKKSTVDNGSSSSGNDVAEVCLSHQSLTSERSTDNVVNADQSFLSTDVEVSSVPANTPNLTPMNSKTFQKCKELTC